MDLHFEITVSRFESIMNQVEKGINEVYQHCGGDSRNMMIAIPNYFQKIIQKQFSSFDFRSPLKQYSGIVVHPNYNDTIVVYHIDFPLTKEKKEVIIKINEE